MRQEIENIIASKIPLILDGRDDLRKVLSDKICTLFRQRLEKLPYVKNVEIQEILKELGG